MKHGDDLVVRLGKVGEVGPGHPEAPLAGAADAPGQGNAGPSASASYALHACALHIDRAFLTDARRRPFDAESTLPIRRRFVGRFDDAMRSVPVLALLALAAGFVAAIGWAVAGTFGWSFKRKERRRPTSGWHS
jgi:hypothetical protein